MLSDTKARNAKPAEKPYRMLDSEGLHLFVTPAGGKYWRWRYQSGGKERLVSLGRYPKMSLAEARTKRDDLRDMPAGPDTVPTVSEVIVKWLERQAPRWKPHHAADVKASLALEIEPTLGDVPIDQVTASMVRVLLLAVQSRGAVETAHRIRQRISSAFGYAVSVEILKANPLMQLSGALQPIVRQGRRAALLELDDARAMIARAETIPSLPVTRLALRLLVLTALRPGELRGATWGEIVDLEGKTPVWRVPAIRMKHTQVRAATISDHLVPLSTQAVDALRVLHPLTGAERFMFPSATGRGVLSENAIGYLLNRAGYASRQTAHGLRATFATVMNERFPADRAVIDLMLAHVPKDGVEAAYNRSTHTVRRREIAQLWADLILNGRPAAKALLELPRRSS